MVGPVPALVIDPHTPTTLYAGTAGGVYKSTDGGASWKAASTGILEQGIEAMSYRSSNINHALCSYKPQRLQKHRWRRELEWYQ